MDVSFWQAVVLGIIQGLTEFLPISSSAHLVITQNLLGLKEPILFFDVVLHLGTLVAVFVVFWQDIWGYLKRPFSKVPLMLILATLPAVAVGLGLEKHIEQAFASLLFVAGALVFTGIILYISDYFVGKKALAKITCKNALVIGCFQALAIFPGVSRSGSTIFGALASGFDREDAARFSFILSIPAILGAAILQTIKANDLMAATSWSSLITGFVFSAIMGYLAIRVFLKLLRINKMKYFSFYCWFLAIVIVVISLIK